MIRQRLVYHKAQLAPVDWKFYLALVVGLFAFVESRPYYINLLTELWPLFLFTVVFLFLQQWLTLRWRVRQASAKIMAYAAGFQLAFAFLLPLMPVHDYKAITKVAEKYIPEMVLEMKLPKSRVYARPWRMSLVEPMHVGYKKGTKDLVISVGMFKSEFTAKDSLPGYIEWARSQLAEYERHQLTVNLYAGSDVPAAKVLDLIHTMRRDDRIRILFMTNDVKRNLGIPKPFAKSPVVGSVDEYEFIELRLRSNQLMIADSAITKKQLYDWSRKRLIDIHENKAQWAILYIDIDDTSHYASLVSVLEENYAALMDLRRQKVKEKFAVDYVIDDYNEQEIQNYANEFSGVIIDLPNKEEITLLKAAINPTKRKK